MLHRARASQVISLGATQVELRVASVGHLRRELLPVRGSPFWQFAGKFSSCSNPKIYRPVPKRKSTTSSLERGRGYADLSSAYGDQDVLVHTRPVVTTCEGTT